MQGFYVYLYDKPGVRHNERPVNKPIHQQRYIMNVSTFLGIPYAKPPLLEGRFKVCTVLFFFFLDEEGGIPIKDNKNSYVY